MWPFCNIYLYIKYALSANIICYYNIYYDYVSCIEGIRGAGVKVEKCSRPQHIGLHVWGSESVGSDFSDICATHNAWNSFD